MNTELRNEWADIRPRLGNLICHIDGKMESLEAEEKRISERRDESYWQGVQDFYEAVKPAVATVEDDGMALNDVKKYFGTRSIVEAICKTDPKTIMETVNKWKADKKQAEEEFQIGDEVIIQEHEASNEVSKGIVTATMDSDTLCVRIPESKVKCPGYNVVWLHRNKVRKTGKHFDGIPLNYSYDQYFAEHVNDVRKGLDWMLNNLQLNQEQTSAIEATISYLSKGETND